MKLKRWIAREYNGRAYALAHELGITELAAGVLCARGYGETCAAWDFLRLSGGELADPMLLTDMGKAVARIERAIADKEKIMVFGDYDVDGITSTYILCDYLASRGADVGYRIPDRISDGYGMTMPVIDEFYRQNVGLAITVDNGITAYEEVEYAASLGIDTVVTDHHECRRGEDGADVIPPAAAVVNPHRQGDAYPHKCLAGVGVTFQLVRALSGGDYRKTLERYGDMTAVGTIADVMRILGENRSLVSEGLTLIENTKNVGLRALLRCAGADGKHINANTVGFALSPRINAAGRMASASEAVELFMSDDPRRTDEIAKRLCEYNRARQLSENEILQEAVALLGEQGFNPENDKAIILCKEGWNGGIIGIVCSRLVERYGLPAIMMTVENGKIKGSGRSVKGFSLYDALASCSKYLSKYGGHELAAGLTLEPENLEGFREAFMRVAAERIDAEDTRPELFVDLVLCPCDIDRAQVEGLSVLEPYGNGWPQPVFAMYELRITDVTPVGCDKHMRVALERDGTKYTGMLFGVTPSDFNFVEGDQVDAAFHLEINTFRGEANVQLVLRDMRYSHTPRETIRSETDLYYRFVTGAELRGSESARLLPAREDLVAVWRYLRRSAPPGGAVLSPPCMCRSIRVEERREMPLGRMLVCVAVFDELGLITREWLPGEDCGCVKKKGAPEDQKLCKMRVTLVRRDGKIDLGKSRLLARLRSASRPETDEEQ